MIFDVDGTLTASTGVDDACLVEAWRRVLGVGEVDTDWSKYAHSTDEGLTLEVCRRSHGRPPRTPEMDSVKREFFGLLRERVGREPGICPPVAGVNDLLRALAAAGWSIGIASGAWEESARIKLEHAGVRALHLPGTFAHARLDGEPARREEIVGATLKKVGWGSPRRLCEKGEGGSTTRAVYVGDGVWDARAARELGIGFVGVRVDGRSDRMRAEGVTRILEDYRDVAGAIAMIERALEEA